MVKGRATSADVDQRSNRLGDELRKVRSLRGETLRGVAESVGFSSAYLLKLEAGAVISPSPHLLRSLARHYDVSYLGLMELAGYAIADSPTDRPRVGVLADALAAEPLTDEEQRAVAAFLTSLRSR